MKRLQKVLLTVTMFAALLAMSIAAEAKSAKVPKSIHTGVGFGSISVEYAEGGDYIKNLKTSSSNLLKKWTSHSERTGKSSSYDSAYSATISLYAKKAGTYTVSFDIYSAAKKKKSSHKVKVYANNDSAIKKVLINGKTNNGYGFTTASSVKVKVTLNKGYKLKKLEYGSRAIKKGDNNSSSYEYYSTETTYKKFSNGGKVPLNKVGYYYYNKYSYNSSYDSSQNYSSLNWSDDMTAYTDVRVTYIDKYTKQEATTFIGLPTRLNMKKSR